MSLNRVHREPDFENIRKILTCQKPNRPTLFEFFMNQAVYEEAAGPMPEHPDDVQWLAYMVRAYAACGYDYTNCEGCNLSHRRNLTQKYHLSQCPCADSK